MAMASIHKEILVDARPEKVWAALRDVGAVHERVVPGFVVDTRLEEGARIVTFANGLVARELIVDIDDEGRRLVWAVVGGRVTHHNASVQVFADGKGGSRLVSSGGPVRIFADASTIGSRSTIVALSSRSFGGRTCPQRPGATCSTIASSARSRSADPVTSVATPRITTER